MNKLITLLFLIGFTSTSFTQNLINHTSDHYSTIAEKIITTSLSEMKGYTWLDELCSEIGPRLSGSEASMNSIYWAKEKFEQMGVDSVWLEPVMVPKWVRGNIEQAEIISSSSLNGKELNIASLGSSIGTPEGGITAEVIEIHSFDELKEKADEVKGKIVFFNRPFNQTFVYTFGGYGDAVEQRVYGPSKAAEYGAVAAIVRSITTKYDNVPHVGTLLYADSVKQIPAAAIGLVDADLLSEALKAEPNLKINLEMDCENLGLVPSFNVIAQINGTEFPDEIILVGGHWDSWDKGCGAHDDGAPCIQTMEVLDIFKRLDLRPKRTIRCVLFINEENGSKGALAYADSSLNKDEYHLAAIESDRGVFTPRGFATDADSGTINKMQAWLPILNKSNIEWIRSGGTGADISKLKNVKVQFGYVPDSQRYFDVHHSANDVFESVNPREMQLGTSAMAIFAYLLSEEGL